ncbi:DUF1294 domain-containing protein [Hydrogenophaga sp. BPS33]|uniref:DUF1294 domain-containing protein n=1 Tax=Hydrogenophaga sp. BPS33 TaxID=2651974 RepID=UPI00131F5665|nr:cold shock and DUF1294 domain-containing protein [Hydrogenophaga sp. BPS33]QHE85864.1 DUF1294 domain-containing protein [Hydrogenophaga sp. BPS33]
MKKQGTVVRWDSEKAFGFIRCPDIPADVFFHLRDYSGPAKPSEGLKVMFEDIHVGGKGPRGLSVEPARNTIVPAAPVQPPPMPAEAALLPPRQAPARSRSQWQKKREERPLWIGLALIGFWLLLWLVGIGMGRFPWVILTAVVLLNLATFYFYWRDKDAAVNDTLRVPEQQLHALAVAGGWPGAWFAQQILRHKTVKQPFRAVYWGTVAVNIGALLGWLLWPSLR